MTIPLNERIDEVALRLEQAQDWAERSDYKTGSATTDEAILTALGRTYEALREIARRLDVLEAAQTTQSASQLPTSGDQSTQSEAPIWGITQ